ncbi:VanW family protein [Paraeggerthella hominis]|uniref:VanW family protein n=1 Tax=Paraeggerthella hominis TaxID=2897351 RepID=UPI001E5F74C8|nr:MULTISPECIES: VanW family protein [Paraeggerthella]MCD2432100.1 VanW family protein [Paraeggerthella hominis]
MRILGHALLALIGLLGAASLALLRAMVSLASRSRAALAVMVLAAVLLVGGAVDFGLNYGKAYPGVRVGEIDVAGKTVDEIEASIEQAYGPRLESNTAIVYANDDAEARVNDEMTAAQDAALAEQLAVEEARANKLAWTTSASDLGATLPARALAEEAVAAGRSDGGIFARIGALFGGRTIQPRADYASDRLEQLASDIDATIGDPRVDFNVAVNGGVATVVQGHDGSMVNRGDFARSLDQALLAQEAGQGSFVARAEHAPLRIDEAAAQAVADAVNRAIADGAQFNYNGSTWKATPSDMGAWIATRIDEGEGSFALSAYIDEAQAKPSLLTHVEKLDTNDPVRVTFQANEGGVAVHTDGTGTMPLVAEGVHALNDALFGPGGKAEGSTPGGSPIEVSITEGPAPATLSFDEAMDLGIISSIASYTTQFTTGAGTENRNHNIKLVSQLLSNSVVKPGGSWSFNKTAGECNEERGFLGAGAIIDGQYDDAVGGGICQVATTMFNAVYEAGYPVKTRHNHSLYISSYPAGRDAAVSWPDLDLVWENDGASDVLVRLSCTDGSVTATLYGVDPGYQVVSTTGEWSEGKHYATKTKVDESLAPGSSYVKTRGTDGRKITVVRTVKSEDGGILHEDPFYSVYDPVTEVVVKGPESPSDETNA